MNNKGFTLIEILVVVCIIAILSMVIVPKIATIKNQTKLAGIDTNLKAAIGQAQILINQFDADKLQDVEAALSDSLYKNVPESDMTNPITGASGCVDFRVAPVDSNAAFAYFSDEDESGDSKYENIGNNEDFAGIILFDAYLDQSNTVCIKFVPLDESGSPMIGKVKVVKR